MERVCTSVLFSYEIICYYQCLQQSAFAPMLPFVPPSCRRTPGVAVPLAIGEELLLHSPRMSDPSGEASPRPDPWLVYITSTNTEGRAAQLKKPGDATDSSV